MNVVDFCVMCVSLQFKKVSSFFKKNFLVNYSFYHFTILSLFFYSTPGLPCFSSRSLILSAVRVIMLALLLVLFGVPYLCVISGTQLDFVRVLFLVYSLRMCVCVCVFNLITVTWVPSVFKTHVYFMFLTKVCENKEFRLPALLLLIF